MKLLARARRDDSNSARCMEEPPRLRRLAMMPLALASGLAFGCAPVEQDEPAGTLRQATTPDAAVMAADLAGLPTADLTVKVTAPTPVHRTLPISYNFTVTNNGPVAATNVQLRITTPGGSVLQKQALVPGGWTCSAVDPLVSCTKATLASGQSDSVQIVVNAIVVNGYSDPNTQVATATVTSDVADPNPADNTIAGTVTIDMSQIAADGGGFGCSAAPGAPPAEAAPVGAAALLLLAGAWLLRRRRISVAATVLGLSLGATSAHAQAVAAPNLGFQLNRHEPTAAGEFSFSVDHPWYSGGSGRYFSGGLTLNYAHDPLFVGLRAPDGKFIQTGTIIQHQFIAHVDLAGSFLDRVLVTASLPVTILESGTAQNGITPTGVPGVAPGDPRLGVMVRLFGQPYSSPFSISLGASVWIPINSYTHKFAVQTAESGWRVLPRLVLGGLTHRVMWSFSGGFYYRPDQSIGTLPAGSPGNTIGPELFLGAGLSYADMAHRFVIGPEATLSTVVTNGNIFTQSFTSLEVLLGAHYNIKRVFQIGVGGGVGLLREPGTPDGRVLLRLAYAPMSAGKVKVTDRDHDGIADSQDACPDEPGPLSKDPSKNGCPLPADRDGDGVIDSEDKCPDVPRGDHPDATKPGCPLTDKDGDGVYDNEDQCPDVPRGDHPDATKLGCPLTDKDGDGVYDNEDQCPEVVAGPHPDPKRPGCPDKDTDGDGVFDGHDLCPDVPAGLHPDAKRLGCPLPDRDGDQVPDEVDACPDKPGAPSTDPKKNGCPGMVEMKAGMIKILQQVFFATNKDVILKKSFPVLLAVADVLKAVPSIKKVEVEGHTDNKGKPELNTSLSDRRAKSVMRFLVENGVEPERLQAQGYGPTRPIADNKTNQGRALNRRVDFRILDPAGPADGAHEKGSALPPPPAVVPETKSAEPVDDGASPKGKAGKGKKGKAPKAPKAPKEKKAKKAKKGKAAKDEG